MGMFDDLVCEMDLPVHDCPVQSWQTKCLDCAMDKIAIRADGALVDTQTRRELKPNAPPDPGMEDSRAWFRWRADWWETRVGPDRPINYTGSINFYSSDEAERWWEFCAFVESGKVQKILPIEIPT